MILRRSRAQFGHILLAVLIYAFFLLLVLWPIAQVCYTGFVTPGGSFTTEYVRLIFSSPVLREGLLNATLVALLVTSLTLILSLPLAVLSVRFEFRARGLLGGLLLVPLVLPPFVGGIGVRFLLSRHGPLTQLLGGGGVDGVDWLGSYRLAGVVLVEGLHLYPIMLLNLQAALANIDPALEQAAANVGAGRWTIFRKITLPLVRPGLFAGCTLVLIWSFTELGTPLIFQFYDITPVQVFKQITDVSDNPMPYALVVVMLAASTLLYVVGKLLLGRGFDAATTKAYVASSARKLTGLKGALAALPFIVVFMVAVLPHVCVVLTSLTATGAWYKTVVPAHLTLGHYAAALVDELAMPSVAWSIRYALSATVIAVIVGLATAVLIVRSDLPGRGVIDSLSMLPLAVPGIVLAFGYLSISIWFKRRLGPDTPAVLDVQQYPVVFLVLAYAARRVPYVVRSAVAGLQQTPQDLEFAAANLGASRLTVLSRITLPLIIANVLAGALLAFAFAMLEVSDSLILAQRIQYYPITKAIYELAQRLGDGVYIASALGVWAMVLLTLTILSANALLGRKMGAVFRV